MKKLRTSPSRLEHDLDATIRHISREIGAGVVDAMRRRPLDEEEEPGWRGEREASDWRPASCAGSTRASTMPRCS
jgi:hypothetical protein